MKIIINKRRKNKICVQDIENEEQKIKEKIK